MLPRPLARLLLATVALVLGNLTTACSGSPDAATARPPLPVTPPSAAPVASVAPEAAALDPLLDALSRARDATERNRLIREIGHDLGARGLVSALSFIKSVAGAPQAWAPKRLTAQLENMMFDNGPHSVTRVVARYRLWKLAAGGERRAVAVLAMMRAAGALAALADDPGEIGQLARGQLARVRLAGQ